MVDSVSNIETELRKVTKFEQTPKDRQTLLVKLHEKVSVVPDDVWETLSAETQEWVNEATKAKGDGAPLPEFSDLPTVAESSEDQPVATASKPAKKTPPSKKAAPPAKKPDAKKAAPSKPAADKAPAKKPAAKPAGEVTGVKAKIKNMILKKTDISTDEIVAKLGANGAEVSRLTVAAVRAEFRHSLRCIKQAGYLDQIAI
jgi:hypothetical protein